MSSGREADFFPVGADDTTTTLTDLVVEALRMGVPVSELLAF
ncbi:hypothetical protein J2X34_004522 [Rhodococcus sp. BE178]